VTKTEKIGKTTKIRRKVPKNAFPFDSPDLLPFEAKNGQNDTIKKDETCDKKRDTPKVSLKNNFHKHLPCQFCVPEKIEVRD